MFNTSQNDKMVEVLSGPERRRRRTPQEKMALLQIVGGDKLIIPFC